ncbi:MAG: hypothetical protein ACLR1P_07550 [Oscillospiraceae bacterium]
MINTFAAVPIRAAFVVFVLYLQHVFNVNSGIRAIIKNANNHVGKLCRDPFGLPWLCAEQRAFDFPDRKGGFRNARFRPLRNKPRQRCMAEIKKRLPVAVFLQRFGYLE